MNTDRLRRDIEPLLQVVDLRKHYHAVARRRGRPVHSLVKAVDGVSFEVPRGSTFALVGESGSGKSSTGRTIIQLERADSGRVVFEGQDLVGLKGTQLRHVRRNVQMVFQDPYTSLNPRKTIEQIITKPLEVHRLAPGHRNERAAELLEMVGLDPGYLVRYPRDLSGGQRQRVGIARALAVEPKLLVCDEPVSALDVSVQAQILNLLVQLQEDLGLTYVFISHDLGVVRHLADVVGVMYAGVLVEVARTEELFVRPLHPYTKALLSAIPVPDPVVESMRERIVLTGEVSTASAAIGCRFSARCPSARALCSDTAPEDIRVAPGRRVSCHFWEELAQDAPSVGRAY